MCRCGETGPPPPGRKGKDSPANGTSASIAKRMSGRSARRLRTSIAGISSIRRLKDVAIVMRARSERPATGMGSPEPPRCGIVLARGPVLPRAREAGVA
jgi:hypothetical protein